MGTSFCRLMSFSSPWMRTLGLLAFLWRVVLQEQAAQGMNPCPNCGKTEVPYPLSTSSSCGHPLYPIICSSPLQTLQLQATFFNYTITHIDASSRTFVIAPAPFVGNSCHTIDSTNATRSFSLNASMPFFLTPNNTVFLLNGIETLLSSPLQCAAASPCSRALALFPQQSCRDVLCCSFNVGASTTFTYGFPIYGQETAYAGVYDLDNNTEPSTWKYGLQIGWNIPKEPPCRTQSECGMNATCFSSPTRGIGNFCLCKKGYEWDGLTGTCPEASYCKFRRRSIQCNKAEYAVGLTTGFVGAIALSVLTFYVCKKRRAAQKAQERLVRERSAILAKNSGGKSARLFTSKEMKAATNNFARNTVLGCGGFGEVYKGVLKDGTVVAIKSAKIGNVKGTDQVLNEVRVLAQVNHRNLVRLLGCCVESALPLMVYEYVANGNLYDHIHGLKNSFLDWDTRLQISLESAEGLAYLHSAAYCPIYHLDVKSSNILLDESMSARVADFGLSRLAEPDLTHVSTCAQGTLGYLDPEYYRTYQLTDKSDVYSFGVVLLELVTSKKAIDFARSQEDVNLVVMVQSKAVEGKLDDVLDPVLVGGACAAMVDSMRLFVTLALECLKENRGSRPSMKEVVEKLRQLIAILAASDTGSRQGYGSLAA